jgi:L-seryl-tRNA(Ser) seleniumtransferase
MGSGTMPGYPIPTMLIAVSGGPLSADELAGTLRKSEPPVFGRIAEGRFLLDLRTVHPDEFKTLASLLASVLKPAGATET